MSSPSCLQSRIPTTAGSMDNFENNNYFGANRTSVMEHGAFSHKGTQGEPCYTLNSFQGVSKNFVVVQHRPYALALHTMPPLGAFAVTTPVDVSVIEEDGLVLDVVYNYDEQMNIERCIVENIRQHA